jgi:hypothetical protein
MQLPYIGSEAFSNVCILSFTRHGVGGTSDSSKPISPPANSFILLPSKSSSLAKLTRLLFLPSAPFLFPLPAGGRPIVLALTPEVLTTPFAGFLPVPEADNVSSCFVEDDRFFEFEPDGELLIRVISSGRSSSPELSVLAR